LSRIWIRIGQQPVFRRSTRPAFQLQRAALALVLGLLLLGCGPAAPLREVKAPRSITVRIGSTNFSEQLVLAELYGQALGAKGFRIDRQPSMGSRENVEPALEAGRIDLYVEYLATMLAFVTRGADRGSPDPGDTHRRLVEALRPRGIAPLNYSPAVNTNGFVVTRATADRYELGRLSDLTPIANQLTFGGPPECPVRPFCLPGLQQTYGISFRQFRILDTGGPQTVAALENGQIDVGLLFTTDPVIQAKQLSLLADDRNLQLADNVTPVVRADLLSSAPPEFATTVNGVSARLTTAELTGLNAQVQLEGQKPDAAAAAWLRVHELLR
jgi:osmoprotectant transport system substrate-binding protein